jgi:hypothetical protein
MRRNFFITDRQLTGSAIAAILGRRLMLGVSTLGGATSEPLTKQDIKGEPNESDGTGGPV